jgi:hypothetical protein
LDTLLESSSDTVLKHWSSKFSQCAPQTRAVVTLLASCLIQLTTTTPSMRFKQLVVQSSPNGGKVEQSGPSILERFSGPQPGRSSD